MTVVFGPSHPWKDVDVPTPRGKFAIDVDLKTWRSCNAAAPVVVNGGMFVGCALDIGHDGPHQLRITWS